tara:strand:+ start:3410 stop:3676 length:267 start_codon:yes stop_codon:yes gene_type:complete
MNKLEILEDKIKKLQSQKILIENRDKAKNKKLLNKQKILLGGYMLNKLKKYDDEKINNFLLDVIETISEKRKNDIIAIELLEKINKDK